MTSLRWNTEIHWQVFKVKFLQQFEVMQGLKKHIMQYYSTTFPYAIQNHFQVDLSLVIQVQQLE